MISVLAFAGPALLLALICAYYGWRYMDTDADPDFALFNLPAFTGSWYGRDFPDCKTPLVYLWFYAIAKIFRPRVENVKYWHHVLVGSFGIVFYLLTQNFFVALAFIVLVNSGWLYAFHGNVGAVPAGLLLVSFIAPPWVGCLLALAAALYEPKLLFSVLALVVINGWYVPFLVYGLAGIIALALLRVLWKQGFDWLIESSVIIPAKMQKIRKGGFGWSPWFTSSGLLYTMPWLIFAVYAKPDVLYWIPPLLYFVLIGTGRVIRQNHFLPLVAWIAFAGIRPEIVLALVGVDWVSAGLYLGDIWLRFYPGLKAPDEEARIAGEKLKDEPGVLWVNGIFSAVVHLYARKPIPYGMNEQVEIRDVTNRREAMKQAFRARPPDYVVQTDAPALTFNGQGYSLIGRGNVTNIWRRGK